MHGRDSQLGVQIFRICCFFGLIWWKIAKKWLLTHSWGFRTLIWGSFGLFSKIWILRPDGGGSAFWLIPSLVFFENLWNLHQRASRSPLICRSKKKNFFLVKMLFPDFSNKNRTFPKMGHERSEIGKFHKTPKIFYQKCSSYNQGKVRRWQWLFFRKAEKLFRLVNEPQEMLPEPSFANNKKVSIFYIFLSKKNFGGMFFSQKKFLNLWNPHFSAKTPKWRLLPYKNQYKILLSFSGGYCCYQIYGRILFFGFRA